MFHIGSQMRREDPKRDFHILANQREDPVTEVYFFQIGVVEDFSVCDQGSFQDGSRSKKLCPLSQDATAGFVFRPVGGLAVTVAVEASNRIPRFVFWCVRAANTSQCCVLSAVRTGCGGWWHLEPAVLDCKSNLEDRMSVLKTSRQTKKM